MPSGNYREEHLGQSVGCIQGKLNMRKEEREWRTVTYVAHVRHKVTLKYMAYVMEVKETKWSNRLYRSGAATSMLGVRNEGMLLLLLVGVAWTCVPLL